ncbi:MAG: hypothetical protein GWM88_17310 [Pseudomonadales bacterium]|nr:hypothetical protein [Pseudomonadales bacterium]NIX09692.1 hypothetical protein [Pseudomonadales bacterium]
MTRPGIRLIGLAILALCVLVYDAGSSAPFHRVVLPIAMAGAAGLMVQSAAAILLAGTLLAGVHARPGDPDWVVGIAYPVLAGLCGVGLAGILLLRFRGRIEATREARWRARRERASTPKGSEG